LIGRYLNKKITQTSSSVHSPALLLRSTSAFFNTMLENRLPIPLMAVIANMTLRLPSILVLRIRKMCWNFSGMTKDWKTSTNYLWLKKLLKVRQRTRCHQIPVDGRLSQRSRPIVCYSSGIPLWLKQIKNRK